MSTAWATLAQTIDCDGRWTCSSSKAQAKSVCRAPSREMLGVVSSDGVWRHAQLIAESEPGHDADAHASDDREAADEARVVDDVTEDGFERLEMRAPLEVEVDDVEHLVDEDEALAEYARDPSTSLELRVGSKGAGWGRPGVVERDVRDRKGLVDRRGDLDGVAATSVIARFLSRNSTTAEGRPREALKWGSSVFWCRVR